MLVLRLLGSPEFRVAGRLLGQVGPSDKGLLLLAYLAASAGERHARSTLAAHFWPGAPHQRGLHNLRQLLLRLRGLLPDPGRAPAWLLTDARTVGFNVEADYWLDLEHLLLPIADGETGLLTQRAALYRGPFLAGCDADLGETLADWLDERRATCHQAALKLEETLSCRHARAGRFDRAIVHAQRCIALEPWQEEGWRVLMRLLAQSGQAAAALRQYAQLCAQLQAELDTVPAAATQALAEQIGRGECGAPMPPVSATPAQPPQAAVAAGERRQISVLECGLSCCSDCADDCHDPESLAARLAASLGQARQCVEACGGHCGSVRPHGFTALFGWPQAQDSEHAARDAALAALEILRVLAEDHPGIVAAIGIDSGVMLSALGVEGSWAVAERALRLRFAAADGTALLGAAAQGALRAGFDLEALPSEAGVAAAWQLNGRRPAGPADAAWPCMGRTAERKALQRGWQAAGKGRAQAILLTGEAGIGKTRLLREFVCALPRSVETIWLECEPRGRENPLLPVVSHLRRRFGLDEGAADETLRERLGDKAERLLPLLTADPAAAPAIGQKTALLRALCELLVATDQPVLLVLEDAHWADASTLEWLDALLQLPRRAGLMVLMSARHWPDLPPALAGRTRQLALAPLDSETAGALAEKVAGAGCSQALVQAAQGVPLFVVELARMQAAGSWSAQRTRAALPDSLRGLLQARLQQAGAHRPLLQIAAILGQEFTLGDWRHLAIAAGMPEARPGEACEALLAAGLLAPASRPGSLRFSHALLQQAALDTLPGERRAELHRHHAARLQARGESAEHIAWHLAQGGLAAQAAETWLRAARQACRIEAYRETAQLAERALASQPAHRTELGALLLAAYAHMALGGYFDAAAQTLYARARALVEKDGADARASLATLRGHWLGASSRASHREARAIAEEMVIVADRAGLDYFRGVARYLAGNSALWQGDFAAAHALLEDAVRRLAQPRASGALDAHDQDFEVTATGYLGWACWFCGDSARALELGRHALALARTRGHLMTLLHAASTLSCICMHDARADEVLEIAEEMIACSQSAELSMWAAIGQLNRYWALARLGREVDVAAAHRLLDHLTTVYPGGAAGFQTMMADAALQRRALDEVPDRLAALAHSLASTEAELYATSQLLIEGELASLQGRPRRAAAKFREAARIATAQGSAALQAEALQWLASVESRQGP